MAEDNLPAGESGILKFGTGHHGSKGTSPEGPIGIVPFQGARLLSMALRGGGWTILPCAATRGSNERTSMDVCMMVCPQPGVVGFKV